MFTRPLSIAALSQTAPYDTFLFRSAARPNNGVCGSLISEYAFGRGDPRPQR